MSAQGFSCSVWTNGFAQDGVRPVSVSSAEEFRLLDRDGKTRAILAISAENKPYLALLDQQGTLRVWLGDAEESGLAIFDVDGKTRVLLSLDPAGEPSLLFRNRQHKTKSYQP